MLAVILAFLSITIAVIWSFVFLLFLPIGIRINKISGSRMKRFLKNVKYASIWSNDEPDGWVCGKKFVGYIQTTVGDHSEDRDLWLVSTHQFYQSRIVDVDIDIDDKDKNKRYITYWVRQGAFWRLEYVSRNIKTPHRPILLIQQTTVGQIIDHFNQRQKTVCLLHGVAGTGKSMTVQYLCAELLKNCKQVHFCDTHIPYEHGDSFDSLYNKVNPEQSSPLVVVLEEIDIVIDKLHHNKIKQHHHIPVQIKNKTDWNSFLDKFDRNIYPNVIIIMTTNQNASYFDQLDPSYMRSGRVDLKIEFI